MKNTHWSSSSYIIGVFNTYIEVLILIYIYICVCFRMKSSWFFLVVLYVVIQFIGSCDGVSVMSVDFGTEWMKVAIVSVSVTDLNFEVIPRTDWDLSLASFFFLYLHFKYLYKIQIILITVILLVKGNQY